MPLLKPITGKGNVIGLIGFDESRLIHPMRVRITQGFSEVHDPIGEQGIWTKSVFSSEKSVTSL